MRILTGGFHHESDSFNPIITEEKEIRLSRGMDMIDQRGENSIGGIIATLLDNGYEVIPTLFARAVPNGVWSRELYLGLKKEMFEMAAKAGHIDGICLGLHGSMLVEGIGDAEKDFLTDLRKLYPDTPITASLDMHCSLSHEMLENCDAFVGYKTAPHIDTYETGVAAAELLIKMLEEGARPVMRAVRVPMIVSGEKSESDAYPMTDIMKRVKEVETRKNVLSASCLMGFPWADHKDTEVSMLVVTDGDASAAEEYSRELAELFWSHRRDFRFASPAYPMKESMEKGKEEIRKGNVPLVLSDSGDNPTAGGSGDFTAFLDMVMKDDELSRLDPPFFYQAIYDEEVTAQAVAAGVGARIHVTLGAKYAPLLSKPLELDAEVISSIPGYKGYIVCDLVLLRANGVDIVVTNRHVGCYDVDMMRALGVVPEERKAICVKLGYLEPEIKAISRSHILVLTPGATRQDIEDIPYKHVLRPAFPMDDDCEFEPRFI